MNYEQKYKEALRVMESLYNVVKYQSSSDALLTVQTIEKSFPELCESEDEKIRKELIRYVKEWQTGYCMWNSDEDFCNDAIAWLEKQGEQKPTPKFEIGDTIHKIGENTVFPMTIEKIEDGDYICNNSHSFVNIKFQDYYELIEQKSFWSEEDEKILKELVEEVKDQLDSVPSPDCMDKEDEKVLKQLNKWMNWLKSIKDRVQPQTKQEWSKEDKKYITHIIAVLESWDRDHLSSIPSVIPKCIDWLKYLKPNNWKPSEEQLEAFEHFVRSIGESGYVSPYDNNTKLICSLLNDLKNI